MSILGRAYGPARSSGKEAIHKWIDALQGAPEGAGFEVGLTWSPDHKWRVYQRIGDHFLMMSSDEARKLHRHFEKMRQRPEWRGIGDDMIGTLGALKDLGSEAYRKNQAGEVPPDGVALMPAEGSA